MKEETAVKWLIEKLESHIMWTDKARGAFEQAKEMEKKDKHSEYMRGWRDGYSKGYSEEEVRLAYFQGEKDSYVKGGQTKEMEDEFIESLKNKLNKSE